MTSEDMFRVFGNIDDSFIIFAEAKRNRKAFGLADNNKTVISQAGSDLTEIYPLQNSDHSPTEEKTSDKKSAIVSDSGTERTIVMNVIRKKSRRAGIFAAAAVLAVTAVAAAVYMGTKKVKKINKEKIITNYFREDESFRPDFERAFPETFTVNENGMYITGFMQFGGEVKNNLKLYDTSENNKYEADLSGYEAESFSPIGITENSLWVYSTDSTAEHDLLRIDRKDMKITGKIHFPENEWIFEVAEDDNGNLTAEKYTLEASDIIDYMICLYDNELQQVSEKSVIDKQILAEEGTLFRGYTANRNGKYYTVYSNTSGDFTLYGYSSEGELLFSKENIEADMNGTFSGIMTDRNGDLVIYSSQMPVGNTTKTSPYFYFDILDPDTGEVTGRYEPDISIDNMLSAWINISKGTAPEGYDFAFTDKTYLYGCSISDEKAEVITDLSTIDTDADNLISTTAVSDNLVLCYDQNTNDLNAGIYVCKTDFSGKITAKVSTDDFGCGENSIARKMRTLDNGDLWMLCSYYDNDLQQEVFFMVNTDPDLKVKKTITINQTNDHCYYQDFIADNNGRIAVMDSGNYDLFFLNSDGSAVKTGYTFSSSTSLNFFESEDKCYFCESDYKKSGADIYSIDFDTNSVSKAAHTDYRINDVADSDGKYDVCFVANDGLYGYNVKDNKTEELINWLDSDFNYKPEQSAVLDENTIVIGGHNLGDNNNLSDGMSFRLLRRVDEETLKKIQERRVLNIAAASISEGLLDLVTDFNKNNEKYRIHIDDYSKYAMSNSFLYDSGISALEQEIITGNTPDMIIFGSDFDYTRYVGFGAFTDINEIISEDDFNRNDYFENILDSIKVNNRQYALPLSYSLEGLSGNKDITGDISEIKLNELADIQAAKPLFYGEQYGRIVTSLIYNNIYEFVDTENYSCDFDNQNFKDVLEIIKECGVTDDEYFNDITKVHSMEGGGRYTDYETKLNKGKCMFEPYIMASFHSFAFDRQRQALKEMIFTGLPSGRKTGPVISPSYCLAVFDSSDKKDGAAELIKLMLSDDAQMKMTSSNDYAFYMYSLPVKKSVYEELWKLDSKSKNSSSTDCYGKDFTVKNPDISVRELFDEMIASATVTSLSDSKIRKIISEETDLYIAGGQTTDETASNIQKKVTMYLKEIK